MNFGREVFTFILIITLSHLAYCNGDSYNRRFDLYAFVGSDWCLSCKKIEKEVFADSLFRETLDKRNINLVLVDFPQRKKLTEDLELKNKELADRYSFDGKFPTLLLSRSDTLFYKKINHEGLEKSELLKEIGATINKLSR